MSPSKLDAGTGPRSKAAPAKPGRDLVSKVNDELISDLISALTDPGVQAARKARPRGTFEELKLERTVKDCDGRHVHPVRKYLVTQAEALLLLARHFGVRGWHHEEDGLESTFSKRFDTEEGYEDSWAWLFLATQDEAFMDDEEQAAGP
jgi:hypothetical protein